MLKPCSSSHSSFAILGFVIVLSISHLPLLVYTLLILDHSNTSPSPYNFVTQVLPYREPQSISLLHTYIPYELKFYPPTKMHQELQHLHPDRAPGGKLRTVRLFLHFSRNTYFSKLCEP